MLGFSPGSHFRESLFRSGQPRPDPLLPLRLSASRYPSRPTGLPLPWSSLNLCYIPRMILPRPQHRLLVGALLAGIVLFSATAANEPAPRFNAITTTGEKFNNASIKGKVVLLEFWTTWCKYCDDEAGFVDKLDKEYRDKGLIVLAINVGEPKKLVKKYLEQHPP